METLEKGLTTPLEKENTIVTNLDMRKNKILKKKWFWEEKVRS